MKILCKTALALSFSMIGAVSSVSALAMVSESEHKIHEIEIIADESKDVRIFTNIDNEFNEIDITVGELADSEKLKQALSELPEHIREKVVDNLAGIHTKGKMVKVEAFADVKNFDNIESERFFVLHSDDDTHATEGLHKVVEGLPDGDEHVKVFKFGHGAGKSADSLIHLLNKGEFSVDELDKIQQALDAKR